MKTKIILISLTFILLFFVLYITYLTKESKKPMLYNHFFVITGGPGAGKSTLINELKSRGYRCFDEVARQIIQEQVNSGGDALPWQNIKRFKEIMLLRTIENYNIAIKNPKEITFFDREIFDLIAYDRITKTESSLDLQNAVQTCLCNKKVFVTPPWEQIYCNDNERKQTYEESIDIYNNILKVYSEYGFEIIVLPKTSVENRVEFIINCIN